MPAHSLVYQPESSVAPTFDPNVHLAYQAPKSRLSMHDLGLAHVDAPSPIGVTAPFPLASLEGVKALRADVLQQRVLDNHMMQTALAGPHAQLRGMAPESAQFLFDFWTHPKTLQAVSEAAGENLVPVFDLELGHTNIQVPSGMERNAYAKTIPVDPFAYPRSTNSTSSAKDDATPPPAAVVGYHRDAYPWVCVLMLSDVSDMIGGETEIRRGDGTTIKAIGPGIGHCVMMQGGYIHHSALPCLGAKERITMVTSFRPQNKIYKDVTNLENIRGCSNVNELHDQFVQSRLDIMQEAIEAYRTLLRTRRRAMEDAFGRRGGLKKPTVRQEEIDAFTAILTGMMNNALVQMPDLASTSSSSDTHHHSKL